MAFPILKSVVLQVPHLPFVAGRPFFMVTCSASFISRIVRHFMQYASMCVLQMALYLQRPSTEANLALR